MGHTAIMQSSIVDITAYGIFWLIFGLTHSFMASQTFKAPWKRLLGPLAPWERLIYNAIAIVAISAVLSFAQQNLANQPLFHPEKAIKWLLWFIQGAGFLLMLWSLSTYDLMRFAGLKQVWAGFRKQKIAEEPFVYSSLHQFVRHPIYSSALLLLWSRTQNEAMLITNIFATIYLLIGMHWEEGRLSALYGEEYDNYRSAIPALIPNPKRRWQPEEAEK
jgi:methanethiol S-methyltransferase